MARILFQTYNTCFQNKSGGVNIRFSRIFDGLCKKKIDVKKFDKYADRVEDFDIIHIFHLDLENLELIKYAKRLNKKVVISSVVNTIGHKKVFFYKCLNILRLQTNYRNYRESLMLADIIIAETKSEKKFISKYYGINSNKILIVPNGADLIDCPNDSIFSLWNGEKKAFVLQVGRFDANKNQMKIIKAFKGTDIQVVFIGGPSKANENYYNECLELAEGCDNFHFLGWVDNSSDILKSAYANARVLVLPSYTETFGMVLVEAAMAGANLAISNRLPILDYDIFSNCPTFNPNNIADIKNKVLIALDCQQPDLKEKVAEFFSWDSIVNQHIEIYSKLINYDKKD